MGCSSDKIQTSDNYDNIENLNTQENFDYQLNELKDGVNLKIYSDILNNANKNDVYKYYLPLEEIGEGTSAKVYKVLHFKTQKTFAMKIIPRKTKIPYDEKNFLKEILFLWKIDHPNILKVFEFFINDDFIFFIMEYMGGGELYELINTIPLGNEVFAATIMKQLLSCVSYLQKIRVCHRDLKPENIMLESKMNLSIKLIDFGTASYINHNEHLTLKLGSPYYLAPELLKGKYGLECDIWSCGIIMYVLLVGNPPFNGDDNEQIMKRILKGKYSLNGEEWKGISKSAKSLIRRLLEYNPKNRITATEAIQHHWIKTYANNPHQVFEVNQKTF